MKRIFLCVLAICFVFALDSCKKTNDNEQNSNDDASQEDVQNSAHVCTFDANSEILPPTCELGGYTLYTCICGKVKEQDHTEALGHAWEAWFVDVEPTFTSDGVLKRKCNNGHYETADIPNLNVYDYTIALIDADPYGTSCTSPLSAYYTYQSDICDEGTEEKRIFKFVADYVAGHTYINDFVHSFDAHYCACQRCGNVDEGSAESHTFKSNTCTVCGFTDRQMIYSEESFGLAVTYNANEENAVIPEFYLESYLVSESDAIKGIKSFANNDKLRSVTIPASIEYIADFAFEGCTSLKRVYYDGTWEQWCSIDFGASSNPMNYADEFYIRNGNVYNTVQEIILPDTLTAISDSAFEGFKNIYSLTIPKSIIFIGNNLNSVFSEDTEIGKVFYGGDYTDWLSVSINNKNSNPMRFTSNFYMTDNSGKYYTPSIITIPDSVTSVGNHQFIGYSALKTLNIDSNTMSIGEYAFSECISLGSVNIAGSCESIGCYAFADCTELTEIYLPADLKVIENFAFKGCTRIRNIYYGSDIGSWCAVKLGGPTANPMHINENRSIEDAADFYLYSKDTDKYCSTESETITIPGSVTSIGDYQFYGFAKIAQIIISDGTATIGNSAFACCSNLSALTIPKSVTNIGKNALIGSSEYIQVYYCGNSSDWDKISIQLPNSELDNALRCFEK